LTISGKTHTSNKNRLEHES
jgi:hypothetical protein